MVVDDLQQLEDLEEWTTKGIGEGEIVLAPWQHDATQHYLLDVDKRRLKARPW